MYCIKCGTMLKEGTKYCTSCGARLDDFARETTDRSIYDAKNNKNAMDNQNIMIHGNNKKFIIVAFSLLVAIIAIFVAITGYNDPVKNTIKYIKMGNYDDAKIEYKKIADDRALIHELDEELIIYADDIKPKIQLREVSYEQIKDLY